jgi:hypothetical protein
MSHNFKILYRTKPSHQKGKHDRFDKSQIGGFSAHGKTDGFARHVHGIVFLQALPDFEVRLAMSLLRRMGCELQGAVLAPSPWESGSERIFRTSQRAHVAVHQDQHPFFI